MKQKRVTILSLLLLSLYATSYCGSGKVADDPRDIVFPSNVERADAQAAIEEAQTAYNALGEDGSAETGKAKEFLDKAKEYLIENEPEAAWAAAIKAKSYCALSQLLQQTRAAGLK
jgi:hypothetical protein